MTQFPKSLYKLCVAVLFLAIFASLVSADCLTDDQIAVIGKIAAVSNLTTSQITSIFYSVCNRTVNITANISLDNQTIDLFTNITKNYTDNFTAAYVSNNTYNRSDIDKLEARLNYNITAGMAVIQNRSLADIQASTEGHLLQEIANSERRNKDYTNNVLQDFKNQSATTQDTSKLEDNIIGNFSKLDQAFGVRLADMQFMIFVALAGGFGCIGFVFYKFVYLRVKQPIGLKTPLAEVRTIEELALDKNLKARSARVREFKRKLLDISVVKKVKISNEAKRKLLQEFESGSDVKNEEIPERLHYLQKELDLAGD